MKTLGTYLCPICLIKKEDVVKMGQKLDMKWRVTRKRHDSQTHQSKVETYRKLIFEKGRKVDGTALDKFFGDSTFPIHVRASFCSDLGLILISVYRMHTLIFFCLLEKTIMICW
jgi:hypothetical protein